MSIRLIIVAALLCSLSASAGEPVVRGSVRTAHLLGPSCLTAPDGEAGLLPGTRLRMRACRNGAGQIFEWNVVTFEIKFHGLCWDAFRTGAGQSAAGDPLGLWYCDGSRHQQWFPVHKNERRLDAFNIVGGGSPGSELCLSVADREIVDGALLTLATCDGGDGQWFRLDPWTPRQDRPVSQRNDSSAPTTIQAASAAAAGGDGVPEPTGP
jgi:hypothetical protein